MNPKYIFNTIKFVAFLMANLGHIHIYKITANLNIILKPWLHHIRVYKTFFLNFNTPALINNLFIKTKVKLRNLYW